MMAHTNVHDGQCERSCERLRLDMSDEVIIFAANYWRMTMKRATVLHRLSLVKARLEEFGVSSVGLFGSTVREENTPSSDIDILIDFADGQETYTNYLSVCELLQQTFSRNKLDVITKKGLSPYIGQTILNEAQYV